MKKILLALLLSASMSFATQVSFNGLPVTLNSNGLNVGDNAPEFKAVNKEFEEVSIGGKKSKVQVLAFLPSLDTNTCELETVKFNKIIGNYKHVLLSIVSKDLPFAQKRFCSSHKVSNIQVVSDYKDANSALRYGTTISAPVFLEGFFGRVIYIIDTDGKIAYRQFVKEISEEPNYEAVLKALNKIR